MLLKLGASFAVEPDFGENPVLDSVVLTIPYFSTNLGANDEGEVQYELDSVFNPNVPIKLSIFENNFFLRDFDPNSSFDDPQNYFSNRFTSISDFIPQSDLEGTPIELAEGFNLDLNSFKPSKTQIELEDEDGEVVQTLAPALRLKLAKQFWQEKDN